MPLKLTRNMLPNLPDEVFEMFIVPLNGSASNVFDSQPGGRWQVHFSGRSLGEFNKLRWRKSVFVFKVLLDLLHPVSFLDIYSLM